MKEVKISKLTTEAFAPYGSFANMIEPKYCCFGSEPITFYRDMLQQKLGGNDEISFSVCVINDRDWVIDCIEYHNHTSEAIVCFDGDYLMHVAPATSQDEEAYEQIKVFYVPKGTMVVTRPGVWHQAGFAYKCDKIHILCALPERTYAIDCHVVKIPEENQIRVCDKFE